ncbi:MAG: 50S ribosomal protein L10 [bacterium]|nr:50S ribosomal protein L10 [bacterium]
MSKTKAEKSEIISMLEKALKNASSAVLVHFTKINVAEESAMRKSLRSDGISYTVAKKSLIRRALDAVGFAHKDVALDGQVAIAYDASKEGDPTAVSRRVLEFVKKHGADKLMILGGTFDGRFVGQDEMREIATIPSLHTLRGMFVNVISSPMRGLVVALSAVAEKKQ